MNENIKKFLDKVTETPELQAKFENVKDPEEAFALAQSIQDGFTKEEFIAEMTKVKEAVDETLSDEDLSKSAGGMDEDALIAVTECISVSIAASYAV